MGVLKLLRRPVRQGPAERGAASRFIGHYSLTFCAAVSRETRYANEAGHWG